MIPIILSAGRGSRVGDETEELPKWFLQTSDNMAIYDHQLSSLEKKFDKAYVVLGHGFSNQKEASKALPTNYNINVEPIVFDNWNAVENAGSAAYALDSVPKEDLLLMCGDIIPRNGLVSKIISQYESNIGPRGHSAVAAFKEHQNEKTAVRWNAEGYITDYGAIEGYEEAGIFILNRDHIDVAANVWENRKNDWFPVVFPKVNSEPITVETTDQFEINTKSDLDMVRKYYQH